MDHHAKFFLGFLIYRQWKRRREMQQRRIENDRQFFSYYFHTERRRSLQFILLIDSILNDEAERSIWKIDRVSVFWEVEVPAMTNTQFVSHFRMCRASFHLLAELLKPFIVKCDTNFRSAIPVEKRLAIALWRLGTCAEFRTISALFGVGVSTAQTITKEVVLALRTHLFHEFIQFPQDAQGIELLIEGFTSFQRRRNLDPVLPIVIGIIDGCHVETLPPVTEPQAAYTYKKRYAQNFLAVVDANKRFIYISVGWAGRCHDSFVLQNSQIWNEGENGTLCHGATAPLNGQHMQPVIIGDSAFPLRNWLMKPFPQSSNLSPEQAVFNKCLLQLRYLVELTFGVLKTRWRCLSKRIDIEYDDVSDYIVACCVLHNFCEEQKEALPLDKEDNDNVDPSLNNDDGSDSSSESSESEDLAPPDETRRRPAVPTGEQARNRIMNALQNWLAAAPRIDNEMI